MRRRLMLGIAVLAGAGLVLAAAAQQQAGDQSTPQAGMMHGHAAMGQAPAGTMQGQMGAPGRGMGAMGGMGMPGAQNMVGRLTAMAFLLPEMQTELGLSAGQVSQLKAMKAQFIAEQQQTSSAIAAAQNNLNSVIGSGTATDAQVRKAAGDLANLEAQQTVNAYQTATKMKAALSPEQRSKVESMNATELRNAMMAHMTMNDIAQMMRFMHGMAGAGMMPGGMMGSGMMGPGMMGPGMMGGAMPGGMDHGEAAPQPAGR